jgi:hypothetical protein
MEFKYRFLAFIKKRYLYLLISWLVALYALYAYVIRGIPFFADSTWAGPLLMFLIFLISGSAYMLSVRKITRSLTDILEEGCDPEKYLLIYRYIIHRLHRKGKRLHFSYFLGYSTGLIAAGRYSDALDVLKKIKGFGSGKSGLNGTVLYFNCLCEANIGLGRMDKAREAYKGLEKSYLSLKPGGDISRSNLFYSKSYIIKMSQNGFKGTEKFFNSMFAEAKSNRERTAAKFYLGEVFLHNGDKARAKEEFGYVAENGNKLHIAGEAKERIAQMA